MESEQSQNFNERLSQWVSNQGFWFQLRYSMAGSGAKGSAAFHLLQIGFRLLIFLLIVAVAGWFYLMKRAQSSTFAESLKTSLKSGFTAKEGQLEGLSRSQGKLGINRLVLQGDTDTFFSLLEARNIRCSMGLLDGIAGKWDAGTVLISRLDVDLRAGADDKESAAKMAEALFKISPEVTVDSAEIGEASFRWGFSEKTRGSISNSSLKIQRREGGFVLTFTGGTFSQNWLKKLEISSLVVSCNRDGMVFETAEFRKGPGTVDFSGLKVEGGERPKIDGQVKISRLDLEGVLPNALKSFVEGSISGTFKASGSTNSNEGLEMAGHVILGEQDHVVLRRRIHLLQALSDVDYVRNYHRVDFTEGAFRLKTGAGGMEIADVSLKAEDLLTLDGEMIVRLPTPEETQAAMTKELSQEESRFFDAEGSRDSASSSSREDFTLRGAASAANRSEADGGVAAQNPLSSRIGVNQELRRLEDEQAERLSRTLRYEGKFLITLPGDAFERAPKLVEQFPANPSTGRISLPVPIEGSLYEMTLKQAEEIYEQRSR